MNKTKLTIGAIITLALAISGTYYISQDDDAYYCDSRDIVMICEKISSGLGTRCYYAETYKICKEGWVRLELEYQEKPEEKIYKSKQIRCNQTECVSLT